VSRRTETLAAAAEDMARVLDVVDAMHADTPEYAAAIIDSMGVDRTCLSALRLLDVMIHMICDPIQDGAPITVDDLTRYMRQHLEGSRVDV
jgi:hypothetical protein